MVRCENRDGERLLMSSRNVPGSATFTLPEDANADNARMFNAIDIVASNRLENEIIIMKSL